MSLRISAGISLTLLLVLPGCRSTSKSAPEEAPSSESGISQSGPFPENKCNQGGIENNSKVGGWSYDARMGCALDCGSEAALKADLISQLRSHRLYGDLQQINRVDAGGAALAAFYQKRQKALGLDATAFASITPAQIYDGTKWLELKDGLKRGDVILNMAFGTPNRAGAFYTKRGILHSSLVVHVAADHFVTLDSGSEALGIRKSIPAQAVWLRPRSEFFSEKQVPDLVKWSKTLSPAPYDNLLIDDWKDFRQQLHQKLDAGSSQAAATEAAFKVSRDKGFAPNGYEGSFNFVPPSGMYCSEGVAAIYSYLGFRQYGDTSLELITSFSPKGDLPDWGIYADALEGFNANSGPAMVMHQAFFNYFKLFEVARKAKYFKIPGYSDASAGSFSDAIGANLKAVAADKGASDLIYKQLAEIIAILKTKPAESQTLELAEKVRVSLQKAAQRLTIARRQTINMSQAAYSIFLENIAYGPHTFLENKRYFELKGVFYNTNLGDEGLGQASWVADLTRKTASGDVTAVDNISTTLYRIKADPALPSDRCVVGEKMEPLQTGPSGVIEAPNFGF